jgi:hypothetical protein
MRVLLNEMPGEKSLFLESEEFDLQQLKESVNEHGITAVLVNDAELLGKNLEKIRSLGLKTGLIAWGLSACAKKLIEQNHFEFVALHISSIKNLKENVGLLRASGTEYELRADFEKLGPKKLEEAYESCKPCDTFAVYNAPGIDFFVDFAKDRKNVVFRGSN